MKKLFLLLAAGLTVSSVVNAQQIKSVMLHSLDGRPTNIATTKNAKTFTPAVRTKGTANKTTRGTDGAWFSYQDAVDQGLTAESVPVTQDSSLLIQGTSGDFNWWLIGLGTGFDPTSQSFGFGWGNTDITRPDFVVDSTNAYTVDSVMVVGYESRFFPNDVDTLYVELTVAQDIVFGQSDITSGGQPVDFVTDGISEDTSYRIPEALYDTTWDVNNIMLNPGTIRITKYLDAAAAADTVAGGTNQWSLAIPGGLSVPAGKHVVAYTHFAPQTKVPFNTSIDSANVWNGFTYDLGNGSGGQPTGDYNTGLIGQTGGFQVDQTDFVLYPAYFFDNSTANLRSLRDPYYSFYLKCASCNELSVANVSNIVKVSAYPNPAVGQLNVPFTMNNSANVTITLTNAIGQVVATKAMGNVTNGTASFDVSHLSNGLYLYTIEASGQRQTGHAIVAH